MKTLLSGVLCCALLAGAAASVDRGDTPDLGISIELKLDEAEKAFNDGRPTKPFFVDAKSLIDQWSDARSEAKKRLLRAIDDLIARAEYAKLHMTDTMRMKSMVIDTRLDRDLRLLWELAKERKPTREQFALVVDTLRHRAEVAKQPPDISQGLEEAINKLMEKAKETGLITPLQLAVFDDQLVKARLDRALFWLEECACSRLATREQFLYVKDLMTDRARVWSEDLEFQAHVDLVKEQVDRLMDRALTAGISRDDCARLYDLCMQRARASVDGT
jgi:hypothetical protein